MTFTINIVVAEETLMCARIAAELRQQLPFFFFLPLVFITLIDFLLVGGTEESLTKLPDC